MSPFTKMKRNHCGGCDCWETEQEMTRYGNSIDALQDLFQPTSGQPLDCACRITKLTHDASLENGIEYCLVEVTCDNGEQYGIQAFGEEAIELHKEALKHERPLPQNEIALVI